MEIKFVDNQLYIFYKICDDNYTAKLMFFITPCVLYI